MGTGWNCFTESEAGFCVEEWERLHTVFAFIEMIKWSVLYFIDMIYDMD